VWVKSDATLSVLAIYRDPQTTSEMLRDRLQAALTPLMPITIISNKNYEPKFSKFLIEPFGSRMAWN